MSKLNLEALDSAVSAVAQGLVEYEQYPMLLTVRERVIQRFKIAMDLSWKLMQRALRDIYGVLDSDIRTKKDTFREAHKNGLINDAESWIIYHEARNQTSHIYDANQAKEVFAVIPAFLIKAQELVSRLKHVA
ncbi:MAG: HI0074 family nucleotidyltransferase substrate-binding subunit [Pseudomonadota bacterium]